MTIGHLGQQQQQRYMLDLRLDVYTLARDPGFFPFCPRSKLLTRQRFFFFIHPIIHFNLSVSFLPPFLSIDNPVVALLWTGWTRGGYLLAIAAWRQVIEMTSAVSRHARSLTQLGIFLSPPNKFIRFFLYGEGSNKRLSLIVSSSTAMEFIWNVPRHPHCEL